MSHLNRNSLRPALSSNMRKMLVALRIHSRFLRRFTSPIHLTSALNPLRSGARSLIRLMKFSVPARLAVAAHDAGFLQHCHARSQSHGCGTAPIKSISSSSVL